MHRVGRLIETLKARGAYFPTLTALKAKDLPTGQGWEKIEEKLVEEASDAERREEIKVALAEVAVELALCNDKAVKIYRASVTDLRRVSRLLGQMVEESPFRQAYPLVLSESALRTSSMTPKATAVEALSGGQGFALVFCSRRYFTEKVDLDVIDTFPTELRRFDMLVGVHRQPIQLFDAVVVRPNQGIIEVRLDGIRHLSHDEITRSANKLVERFNTLLSEAGDRFQLEDPVNLFPAISSLYDRQDGAVTELGHITTGASVKHERMRRKTIDLRSETYHDAGKRAVGDLDSYRLAVHWTVTGRRSTVGLRLPGTVGIASDTEKQLFVAEILSCISSTDYEFVLGKLLNALSTAT